MPVYLYRCEDCDHETEIIFKIADRPEYLVCGREGDPFEGPSFPCSGIMYQVITAPTLKLSDAANVPWIRRAMNYLEPEKAEQYDTRQKYQAYLDDKGLRPADGHNLSEI